MSFRSIDECGATVHISCIGSLLRITGTGVSGVGSTYFFRVLMDAGDYGDIPYGHMHAGNQRSLRPSIHRFYP